MTSRITMDGLLSSENPGPLVSVIVPCYNEQATICLLLEALHQQTFPRGSMEVIIADGMSEDRTRQEIDTFQAAHPDLIIRVVDNPKRTIPSGLNTAITAAYGRYIVRLDAHSIPDRNYIRHCVQDLDQKLGENVGGVWEIRPQVKGAMPRAIATAAAHPLAVGDAQYRFTRKAGPVDTVPFGAFRRELIERIGGYDESLLTNEDYEFNTRIRQSGGKVWLDPQIRSTYFARSTLGALASQYWRYGYWKAHMLKRYPHTIRWRQALPPIFVLSLIFLSSLSPWSSLARLFLLVEVTCYLLVLLVTSTMAAIKKHDAPLIVGMPLAIAIMHLTWGSALVWGLLYQRFFHSQSVSVNALH